MLSRTRNSLKGFFFFFWFFSLHWTWSFVFKGKIKTRRRVISPFNLRTVKISLTTLPINIKDNFYGWESRLNDRFGKTCSPFPSLLPPHKMIFLYTTSLLRVGEETANKFLAQTKMAAIAPGKHTHSSRRPNLQAFLSVQEKGAIHLICALFILKEHAEFLHSFILFLPSTHKTFEKPAVNGQITTHNLEGRQKKKKEKDRW